MTTLLNTTCKLGCGRNDAAINPLKLNNQYLKLRARQ